MEEKILVTGEGIHQEMIGESLFDCVKAAFRRFKGHTVELIWIRSVGHIDGEDLLIEDAYLDTGSVKEIIKNGTS